MRGYSAINAFDHMIRNPSMLFKCNNLFRIDGTKIQTRTTNILTEQRQIITTMSPSLSGVASKVSSPPNAPPGKTVSGFSVKEADRSFLDCPLS